MIKNFSATTYGNENTVIVAIDDRSINEIPWPWALDLSAQIIDYFAEYTNAKVFASDIRIRGKNANLNEYNRNFYSAVNKIKDKYVATILPLVSPPEDLSDYENYEKNICSKYRLNIDDQRFFKPSIMYNSMDRLPEEYANVTKYIGFGYNVPDNNNTIVATLPVVNVNNYLYPSLPLMMYLYANNTKDISIYDGYIKIDTTNLTIPLLKEYQNTWYTLSYIKYYKLHKNSIYSHKQYSAIDIIKSYNSLKKGESPLIDPEEFNGKTVLFGTNARGEVIGLEDSKRTPVNNFHPGVDIQATIYDNYVNGEFIVRPSLFLEFLAILVSSLIILILVLKLGFALSISTISGIALGYYLLCAYYLYPKGIAPDAVTPFVTALATLIFGYAFKFIAENKNKEKVKNAMGKYLSKTVMKNVVKNIDNVKLGGRKAVVTVLFADIRGFTSMSEKMSAEEVSLILNEYFSAIEPIITKYNGVINKFIGDAVMAIFGDPIDDEMHQMNAVLCANEMLKRVRKLRNKWMDENKPEIEIGIGINTGEVFVGNIGSETRLEYTVIGDTVNIASRIESYNKVYKTNFLIGSTTYNSVKNRVDVIKISGVTIRGKQNKMDIYEILRVNSGEE